MLSLLIPTAVSDKIEKRLTKLAKKAGVVVTEVAGVTYLGPRPRDAEYVTGFIPCHRYTVGDLPRVAGWAFVGRLEHTEAGVMTACAPGETLPEAYRTAKPVCAHCGTSRQRKDTFVIRNPEGELRQIGRNCLADFLMTDPAQLIAAAELAKFFGESNGESDEIWGGSGRGEWYKPSTTYFVACAVASIARHGFHKSDTDAATVRDASWLCEPSFLGSEKEIERRKDEQPTVAQRERADTLIAWARGLTGSLSDFEHNLKIACTLPAVARHAGILAALPRAYDHAMGKIAAAKEKPASAGFWGTVGKREATVAVLEKKVDIDGEFPKTLCIFRTTAGHVLCWFASGSTPPEVGVQYALKATVKRQAARNGVDQTVVSRVAWVNATTG